MNYKKEKPVEEFLKKQSKDVQNKVQRVLDKIKNCNGTNEFFKAGINCMPIEGGRRNRRQLYRIRVGSIRLVFFMDKDRDLLDIIEAGNRGDMYKQKRGK